MRGQASGESVPGQDFACRCVSGPLLPQVRANTSARYPEPTGDSAAAGGGHLFDLVRANVRREQKLHEELGGLPFSATRAISSNEGPFAATRATFVSEGVLRASHHRLRARVLVGATD